MHKCSVIFQLCYDSFLLLNCAYYWASQLALVVKNQPASVACQCSRCKRHGFNPWVGKIHWRRKWQHTPVFFQGKSHGQRSLVGYGPWGHKEWDMTERLSMHTCMSGEKTAPPALFCSLFQAFSPYHPYVWGFLCPCT